MFRPSDLIEGTKEEYKETKMFKPNNLIEKIEKEYENKLVAPLLDITEPPCKNCFAWNPHIKQGDNGKFCGIKLCTGSMMDDFSCFFEKSISEGRPSVDEV